MTKFNQLSIGNSLSEVQYYKVVKIVGNQVQLQNDNGEDIIVDDKYVESCLFSADQFEKTVNVNKTEAANIFLQNAGVVMTVVFYKQIKETDVLKEIMEAHQNSTPKDVEKAFKSAIKKALHGERREIVGRHNGSIEEFGRVHFTDMQIEKDSTKSYDVRQRLVDPRTIESIIVKGVKYIVK